MDYKAQKVCDLINNAIDEVRRCRLMVDKAAPKHKVKAQLNSTEHLLLNALGMIGGDDAE